MASTIEADADYAGPDAAPPSRSARVLFVATILTGSFLLFLVQPMIARMALPKLGGAPAVWNSAMLVYQALLLGGYAYAHWLSTRAPKTQGLIHIALFAVAAIWLPLHLVNLAPPSGGSVVFWVPWLLLASIGPLFLAVSAQAPLMQRWYALSGEQGEPYALYAASNFGSFGGLIAYPLLVEPFFTLRVQSWIWSSLYVVLALLVVACALTLRKRAPEQAVVERADATSPAPTWRQRGYWILLAAIPSGLMLSTTTHLTTDLLAMPLIWAIPLGLYLLSFTVAFATNQTQADAIRFAAPVILLVAGGFSFMGSSGTPWLGLGASILLLFTIAVVLHNLMYRSRPAPEHLTSFYLMMSIGGALGGLFCAIIAPALFDWTWEHPILILLAAFLIPQKKLINLSGDIEAWRGEGRTWFLALALFGLAGSILLAWTVGDTQGGQGAFLIGVIVAVGILVTGYRWAFLLVVAALMLANGGWQSVRDLKDGARTRSYFGVYTVRQSPGGEMRWLTHGTTIHGLQSAANPTAPISYYGPRSGVGLGFSQAARLYGPQARLGVVGLGTGTLGCYAKPGMSVDFYEIDPAMVGIAKTRGLFSYVEKCAPNAPIHIGDARLTLAEAKPASLDLLAIDAFSSDAIPVHLLTAEAFGIYDRVLAKDGILLVHISNRFIDLKPVIAAEAKARGLHAAIRADYVNSVWEAAGYRSSNWIALSRDKAKLDAMTGPLTPGGIDSRTIADPVWQPLVVKGDQVRWTDDYASVLPLLSLKRLFL